MVLIKLFRERGETRDEREIEREGGGGREREGGGRESVGGSVIV